MRTTILTVAAVLLTAAIGYGQVRGTRVGSAVDREHIQKYKDMLNKKSAKKRANAAEIAKLRERVVALADEAAGIMKEWNFTSNEVRYVVEYVNVYQDKAPSLVGVNDKVQKMLDGEVVKAWVKAEGAYISARDK